MTSSAPLAPSVARDTFHQLCVNKERQEYAPAASLIVSATYNFFNDYPAVRDQFYTSCQELKLSGSTFERAFRLCNNDYQIFANRVLKKDLSLINHS